MKKVTVTIEEYRKHLKLCFLSYAPNIDLDGLDGLDELVKQFKLEKFSKNDMIIAAGDYSNALYFVCKGLVRMYYVKDDKEITNWFMKENMVFAGSYSIFTGEKNYSNYEAFEDTYLLKIDFPVLESFFVKYHSLEHIGRKLVEAYYGAFMKKTYDVLFLSAEERYQIFLKEQSDLMNRLPLRIVASYLGITQETLSRLRARF